MEDLELVACDDRVVFMVSAGGVEEALGRLLGCRCVRRSCVVQRWVIVE